jgi:hypothetical protein
MPELGNTTVESALEDALMTMAFISPLPPEDSSPPVAPACLTRITFAGAAAGTLELVCPLALGAILAANCLGTEPDAAESVDGAPDALKELINVACGGMLRNSGATAAGLVEMTVPTLDPFDLCDWNQFIQSGAIVLDADGNKLALRMISSN